jgi:hypothetical protein
MLKLNLHARIEIAVVAALLLGSCDGPGLSDKQRDEVEDIADAVAGDNDKINELESRISEVESRLNI